MRPSRLTRICVGNRIELTLQAYSSLLYFPMVAMVHICLVLSKWLVILCYCIYVFPKVVPPWLIMAVLCKGRRKLKINMQSNMAI